MRNLILRYLKEGDYLLDCMIGGGGSKLKATAGEYQKLNDFLKNQDIAFIWVTDGKGWLTAKNPLKETFDHNDHVINLEMLKNNVLEDIVDIKKQTTEIILRRLG